MLPSDESWNQGANFKKLVLADSVIQESLRCHPILIKGLTKEVVPSQGLNLPDGTHMPRGGWVGIPVLGIHRDERYYANPEVYEPFRFVKERASEEPARTSTSYADDLDAAKPTSTYLGFGYGRHAWWVHPISEFKYPGLADFADILNWQPRTLVCGLDAQDDSLLHHVEL